MHWMLPGPQDSSHVAGSGTGLQTVNWRSKTPLIAIRDNRCPAVSAVAAETAPRRMVADNCILVSKPRIQKKVV